MHPSLRSTLFLFAALRLASALVIPSHIDQPSDLAKRTGVNCPATDKDGSALSSSSPTQDDAGNALAVCAYPSAGSCTYFTDGSFSSGSSSCPKGLAQNAAAAVGSSTSSTTTSNTQQKAGAISGSVVCPATDKDGSALTSSSPDKDDAGNALVNCVYTTAGSCTYFTDGSFSSGSSECPKGDDQTQQGGGSGNGGGQQQQAPTTTSTSTPAAQTTQTTPPAAPPPVTTSTTTTPLTTSTTSTTPLTTSTTPLTTTTPPPIAVAPTTTTPTSTEIDLTTVVVNAPAPSNTDTVPVPQGGLGGGAAAVGPPMSMLVTGVLVVLGMVGAGVV